MNNINEEEKKEDENFCCNFYNNNNNYNYLNLTEDEISFKNCRFLKCTYLSSFIFFFTSFFLHLIYDKIIDEKYNHNTFGSLVMAISDIFFMASVTISFTGTLFYFLLV
jgi:hypothetical protein